MYGYLPHVSNVVCVFQDSVTSSVWSDFADPDAVMSDVFTPESGLDVNEATIFGSYFQTLQS